MNKQLPISLREWAFFGLRWVIPLGLVMALFNPDVKAIGGPWLLLAIALTAIVSNLIVLILFLNEHWSRVITAVFVSVDVVVTLSAVAVGGAMVGWVGLVAATAAGAYFGWLAGLGVGGALALAVLGLGLTRIPSDDLHLPALILSVLVLPAAGPLASLLSSNKSEVEALRSQLQSRSKKAEQIARTATEYMRVVYEMTDVLSASKLDPRRVLATAVGFAAEALERVGIEPPLFSAVLLFAGDGNSLENVLKMARASARVPLGDMRVIVPGVAGVIAMTLEKQQPLLCHTPADDPELRGFESFGKCGTVLCLPLRSGNESYGVMLVGAHETDAFREMHVELMRAVANQAAASLNNARLYGSLLEQRDRVVGIEKAARAQLASELHDGPTQGVAAITMRLNYIRKLIEKKPEAAIDELYKIEDLARRTTKEIRHMLFEMRPVALEQGLAAGLEQLAAKMKETYDQNVEIAIEDHCDSLLDTQAVQTLFSIVTETLTNARKHAKADRIVVQLGVRQNVLVLEISDNGVGFDVEKALTEALNRAGHLGLLNLQERARLLEGTLDIQSEVGKGTRTTVAIPLEVLELRRAEEANRQAEALEAGEPEKTNTAGQS